mmetsp:Transcript_25835/g.60047  ORF Transcript_25835/g.60047 Transcript_25835/m.60047 type:complete len:183 (-) Transcript_25835:58-606(-)
MFCSLLYLFLLGALGVDASYPPGQEPHPWQATDSIQMTGARLDNLPIIQDPNAAASSTSANDDPCEDREGTFAVGSLRGNRSCKWLGTQTERITHFCKPGQSAFTFCKKTCATCNDTAKTSDTSPKEPCMDSAHTFQAEGSEQTCEWLATSAQRVLDYCVEGRAAFSVCKKTCGACNEFIPN